MSLVLKHCKNFLDALASLVLIFGNSHAQRLEIDSPILPQIASLRLRLSRLNRLNRINILNILYGLNRLNKIIRLNRFNSLNRLNRMNGLNRQKCH